MIYQHPLAYLLGIEGVALLRAWAGDFDKEFVDRRLAEIRRLLAAEALAGHDGVLVDRGDTRTGYRRWAPAYDEPRNSLFDVDEPVMHEIIDALPPGDALDAACGTGRYAAHLVERGHRVTGVDSSPDMLERARARVPRAEFLLGDLRRMPQMGVVTQCRLPVQRRITRGPQGDEVGRDRMARGIADPAVPHQ